MTADPYYEADTSYFHQILLLIHGLNGIRQTGLLLSGLWQDRG